MTPKKLWIALLIIFLNICAAISQDALPESETRYNTEGVYRPMFEKLYDNEDFSRSSRMWLVGSNEFESHVRSGVWTITANGSVPLVHKNFELARGNVRLKTRIRTETPSQLKFSWLTSRSPRRSIDKQANLTLTADGQWHEYEMIFPVFSSLTNLVIEFCATDGSWEIDEIQVWVIASYPLAIKDVQPLEDLYCYTLVNMSSEIVHFTHLEKRYEIDPNEKVELYVEMEHIGPLKKYHLHVDMEDLPSLEFTSFLYDSSVNADWIRLPWGDQFLEIESKGIMGRILSNDGETIAMIAPLAHRDGWIPEWNIAEQDTHLLRFTSPQGEMKLDTSDAMLKMDIELDGPFEGPVVRVLGEMLNGLMAGSEYLNQGEISSNDKAITAPNSRRHRPNKLWVTMPLMAFRTPAGTLAMTWDDMTLQPTFITPNRFDAAEDHRFSLQCTQKCQVRLQHLQGDLTDAILASVRRHGLPDIPDAPRSFDAQMKLSLAAFQGPLAGGDGTIWGIYAEPDWPRKPYADLASTVWRLTKKTPLMDSFEYGGSNIANETIYFVTENAYQWYDLKRERVQQIISEIQPNGTVDFPSRFPEIDANTPRIGIAARRALELGNYALLVGDENALQHCRTLLDRLNMKTVPRGAHFWEAPFHTPDLLCAAYLVEANLRVYQSTSNEEYLRAASRWAVAGLPFIYFWEDRPQMLYSSVRMYGASYRTFPVWFGASSPGTGAAFGYAIAQLGYYDQTLDWHKIARGLLHAAETVQIESGPNMGCLPDCFSLETLESVSWHLNPASIVSLRLLLDAPPESLVVAFEDSTRVVSPFPVKSGKGGLIITDVPEGQKFQILINGLQVINVQNHGEEIVVPIR